MMKIVIYIGRTIVESTVWIPYRAPGKGQSSKKSMEQLDSELIAATSCDFKDTATNIYNNTDESV